MRHAGGGVRVIRYLTGASTVGAEACAFERGIGLMIQPGNSYHLKVGRYPFWAADNGAFTRAAGGFSEERFTAMLDRPHLQEAAASCLFVVAPDVLRVLADGTVIGDALATVIRFHEWEPRIRHRGFPVALVAQDGFEALIDKPIVPWHRVDCLFIGGSTEWKLSEGARICIVEAKRRGKLTHMGRVNSFSRLARASEMLCDTADGTFLMFAPKTNLPRLLTWLDQVRLGIQAHLPWGRA
jgi:hypothetical protein